MTIFTTLTVRDSIPLFFEKHQNRLAQHAQAFAILFPKGLYSLVAKYIHHHNLTENALRIELQKNEILITHRTLPQMKKPFTTITIPDTRAPDKIYKTTARSINELATKFAQEHNADDALFISNGNLIESPIANIFSMDDSGTLITPPIAGKGLNGITRQVIMENQHVLEREIPATTTGPLVLVNSLRIQPITSVNGKLLQSPEELVERLRLLLQDTENSYVMQKGWRAKETSSSARNE